MKKFVKVLAILLAIFMALAVFAACKEKNNDATPDDKPVDNNPVDDNPKQDDPTPAHEHAWDEGKVTKEATCTEAGEKVYTCSCGETKTEAIAALGHTWDDGKVTKEATVDAEGEKTFKCTVCGETKVEKIDKLPVPETPEAKGTLVDGPDAKYVANGDNTYTYLYFTGDEEATEVVIPAHLNGLKVVAIDDEAFKGITQKFTKITIENGIEVIGASAFEGCTGITEIVIPDSVTEIGENAFKGCTGLISVKLGAGTETIPANAFSGCAKIEFLDLGDGLYELDPATFGSSDMTLVKVIIGKNMVDLNSSFEYAVQDFKLVVIENNSESPDFTAGTNVTALLKNIADAKAEEVDVHIEIDENGYVFYFDEKGNASLMSYIGGGQKADPEDDEEVIDPAKKILRLPESAGENELSYVVYRLAFFSRADIETVIFSEGVTGIGDFAFADSALKALKLSKSVTKIGDFAFAASKLTKVTIPASVTTIGQGAFGNCVALATVNFASDSALKEIGVGAFDSCKALTAITIPATVDTFGVSAFGSCNKLATVTFAGNAFNTLPDYLFAFCPELTALNFTTSVTSMGKNVFDGCAKLLTINYTGTKEQANAISKAAGCFANTANKLVIYCSDGNICINDHTLGAVVPKVDATCTAKGTKAHCDCTVCGAHLIELLPGDYSVKADDEDLVIPATGHADPVYGHCPTCGELLVSASAGLTYSDYYTTPSHFCNLSGSDTEFSGTELIVPAKTTKDTVDYNVTGVKMNAFKDLTTLKYVILTDKVTAIGKSAFEGCTALESIELYDSLKNIYADAFKGCSSLTSITFHGTKDQWNAVTKETGWDAGAGSYTVHCSDGDIAPLS